MKLTCRGIMEKDHHRVRRALDVFVAPLVEGPIDIEYTDLEAPEVTGVIHSNGTAVRTPKILTRSVGIALSCIATPARAVEVTHTNVESWRRSSYNAVARAALLRKKQ